MTCPSESLVTSCAPASMAASSTLSAIARRDGIDHLADAIEHEGDGARLAHRAAVLGEVGAEGAGRTVAVIGERLDDDCDAAGTVAFVADGLVALACRRRHPC